MTSSRNANPKDSQAAGAPPPAPGALTYNGYLMVDQLKGLQVCQSNPPHHDEPLFIIIHQAYELWFKLILHEIDEVFSLLAAGRARRATFYMQRVLAVMKLLVQQIHILETMKPQDFLGFRYNLSPASGFGSSQFREIEFAAGLRYPGLLEHFRAEPAYEQLKKRMQSKSLGEAFYELLTGKGFHLPMPDESASDEQKDVAEAQRLKELLKLYVEEERYPELHDFAEALVEFDELLFLWRSNHVIVVERMIGFKRGTGGSEGVGYLQTTLQKRCFPDLWKLRTALDQPGDSTAQGAPSAQSGGGCPFHSG